MITSAFAAVGVADTNEADPADEVFIDEDGDAVLLYEDEDGDDAGGELGVDVGESVAYALITDEMEEDISAAFSMALDGDSVESSGSLTADRPAEIADFSMDVSGEHSKEVNEFAADLELVLDTMEVQEASLVQSITSSGDVVSSADAFSTEGEFNAVHSMPADGPDTGFSLTISEDDGSYTIDVREREQRTQFEADGWETEADAKQSLEEEFQPFAQELGGDATVTIHSHRFDEDDFGGGYLDVEYTVELENVKDGLEDVLAQELADDPELDIGAAEADQIAADIVAAELDAFEFSYLVSENTIEGEWNVALSDFDSAALAVFDLIEATDDEFGEEFDDFTEKYEAQQAADLTTTTEWDLAFEHTTASEATLTVDVTSDADNWEEYVSELEERDVDVGDSVVNIHGETVGDEIDLEFDLEFTQEEFLDEAVGAMIADLEADPTADEEAVEFLTAFDEADLELAKFDLEMDDGEMEIEMGALFEDFSAFEGTLGDVYHGLAVTHLYADLDEEVGYVYATDMVDEDATEDDVREHAAVDDDTVVHMPGDWDEEHPRLDMTQVSEYMGIDIDDEEDEEAEEDDDIPGFGVAVALVAVLSTVLWMRRH
ncbi:PGF-CTERM sorting domain-containing protein [Natrialbaceae archaeon A-gly3]